MNAIMAKLGLQTSRRIYASILGVAVAVMYLTGTLSMVAGLEAGTSQFSRIFEGGPVAVISAPSLSESMVPLSVEKNISGSFSSVKMIEVYLPQYAVTTYLFSVNDTEGLLGMPDVSGDEIIAGADFPTSFTSYNIILSSGNYTADGNLSGTYRSSVFPDRWLMCSESLIISLSPELRNKTSFLILSGEVREDMNMFRESGYNLVPLVSLGGFFTGSVKQVEGDLSLIVFSSSLIIILIVYSIMSIEVSSRRADIRILRHLGAARTSVMSIFILQSLFIGLSGAAIGISLGFIGANAITSTASFFGRYSFIYPQATLSSIVMPLAASLFSAFIGGLIPSFMASRNGGASA